MKIIIKEDNLVHQKIVLDYLITIKINLNIDFEVFFLDSIESIMEHNTSKDIIINIIDIIDENNPLLDGISISTKIREVNQQSYIIYLTSHDSYLLEAVNHFVEPIAYINKGNLNAREMLQSIFQNIVFNKNYNVQSKAISFKDEESNMIYLKPESIYAIYTNQTRQKYVDVLTKDKIYVVRGKIIDFINIDPNIVRCSKSTLINKTKIKAIKRGTNPKNKIIEFNIHTRALAPTIYLSTKYKNNLI